MASNFIRPSRVGFAFGAGGQAAPAGFSAAIRADLFRMIGDLDAIARGKLQSTAEVALLQTLGDITESLSKVAPPRYLVRTAVAFGENPITFDEHVCDSCRALHQTEVRFGSPEYTEFKPPNHCEGGARCRCRYLPVPDQRSGWTVSTEMDSTPARVAGTVTLHKGDTESIRPLPYAAKTARKRPHENLAARLLTIQERADLAEGDRLIRQVVTDAKPRLNIHVLAALEHLRATGMVPPFSPQSTARLVRL